MYNYYIKQIHTNHTYLNLHGRNSKTTIKRNFTIRLIDRRRLAGKWVNAIHTNKKYV